jgi:hypothetical protein
MWSVNEKQCIKQLKRFNKHNVESTKLTLFTLLLLRQIHELTDIQHDLKNYWDLKIADNMQWSDLVREKEYKDFIDDVKQAIANTAVKEVKLKMWRTTREKELNKKKFSRKRLYSETDNLIWFQIVCNLTDSKQMNWGLRKKMRSEQ